MVDSSSNTYFCCCPNAGVAPNVFVFAPKAGGGAAVDCVVAPKPNEDCCGAPNVNAEKENIKYIKLKWGHFICFIR